MAHIFWVPAIARWENIRNQAKQPDIGKRIDDALIAIEQDNAALKGILDKRFARTQLDPGKLGELIDLISSIGFGAKDKAKDTLGEVYEYFLGQFANAAGRSHDQYDGQHQIICRISQNQKFPLYRDHDGASP
jgi:type I restriction enzyme M protein